MRDIPSITIEDSTALLAALINYLRDNQQLRHLRLGNLFYNATLTYDFLCNLFGLTRVESLELSFTPIDRQDLSKLRNDLSRHLFFA